MRVQEPTLRMFVREESIPEHLALGVTGSSLLDTSGNRIDINNVVVRVTGRHSDVC